MKGATFSRVAQFAALVFFVFANSQGQVERASLAGTVTDASGAVIPGVTIKVISDGTNTAVNLGTDAAGEFRAVNLTPAATRLTPRSRAFSGT
ncbi:MAG TPA: carboxypeptidase-like regulatory domain-containing protein [Bryobacteraceae bacterium]|nr:carboxypeptidase-like regulatory domain-containing protein [Bryobacteraceae bacterium]